MAPPYWQTAGYGVDFPFENYERMADFMRRCKGKMMVSINDHSDIRRVFESFHFETLDIRYATTNQRQGRAQQRAGDHEQGASGIGRVVLIALSLIINMKNQQAI
jgi:hypothetical protein